MEQKDNMPAWAYWGLWGIRSRSAAMAFFVGTLILSVVIVPAAVIIKDYILCVIVLVPIWYWLSIKWVDKNSTWAVQNDS